MAGKRITVSEALGWYKILEKRHGELVNLRNQNARVVQQRYGKEEPVTTQKPVYNAIKLDMLIATLARELRIVDAAIKHANANTPLGDYEMNDAVLGELDVAPIE